MPWGGIPPSQLFTRSNGFNTGTDVWQQDDAGGVDIESSRHDAHDQDLADGISSSLKKDGGNAATSNLPMGGFRHSNVGEATARTHYARFSDLQDGKGIYCPTVGGTADAITLTTGYSVGAYAAGQTFRFIAGGTNTTAGTVIVDGISIKDIKRRDGSALSPGDIISGALTVITYDGTRFQIESAGYTVGGADVAIADGGTGQSTATAAFNALSPVTTRGDLIVRGAANNQRLAVGTANQILKSDGTDPAWGTIAASDTLAGFIEIAVRSELETPSSSTLAIPPARQHFHPGHPKAGGLITGGGTPVLTSSYNITGITDLGQGICEVTIANDMASANWWGVATVENSDDDLATGEAAGVFITAKAAGSFQLVGEDGDEDGGSADRADWFACGFAIFGALA